MSVDISTLVHSLDVQELETILQFICTECNCATACIFSKSSPYSYTRLSEVPEHLEAALQPSLDRFTAEDIKLTLAADIGYTQGGPWTAQSTLLVCIPMPREPKSGSDNPGILILGSFQCSPNMVQVVDLERRIRPALRLCHMILTHDSLRHKYKEVFHDKTYFSKDLFLANISHEIRTPLNGVIGYNQLLLESKLQPDQLSYVKRMNHCSVQLMQIINDVIDFSKLSSGHMRVERDCFDLHDMMDSVRSTLGKAGQAKHQHITFSVAAALPGHIVQDRLKVIQVLVNLLSNAIKFTPDGGAISATCALHPAQQTLVLTVTDNGPGISAEDQCKLFNSFVQLENSTSKKGSGLGLAITKRIVDLLGGEINLVSQLQSGSTFTVSIPYQLDAQCDLTESPLYASLNQKRILIVSHSITGRITTEDVCTSWGMVAATCSSVQEAIRHVSNPACAETFVVADLTMDDTPLYNLSEALQRYRPTCHLIGVGSTAQRDALASCHAVVPSPLHSVQLFTTLTKLLDQESAQIAHNFAEDHTCPLDIPPHLSSPPGDADVRILIAEDCRDNSIVLKQLLLNYGFKHILIADNGLQAVQMIMHAEKTSRPYHLLLLDLRMPVMDGYQVIDFLQEKKMPLPIIIVVTACVLKSDRDKCTAKGVTFFIRKPLQVSQLRQVVSTAVHSLHLNQGRHKSYKAFQQQV